MRTVLILTFVFLLPVAALAHSGATGIVKERMDLMKEVGRATKVIAEMIRGRRDYDAAGLKGAALAVAGHGGAKMLATFPEGSLDHPTEALPVIWTDWERFRGLAVELEAAALAVADGAAQGPGGPSAEAAKRMLATCKQCHDAFRVRK